MAWLTRQALRADALRRAAETESELEQRVSLALWRMDTELAPIIAEEVVRPPAAFRPSTRITIKQPQFILLRFEARQQGRRWSPQLVFWKSYVPQVDELGTSVDFSDLLAQLPETPMQTADYEQANPFAEVAQQQPENDQYVNTPQFFEGNTLNPQSHVDMQQVEQVPAKSKQVSKVADFVERSKRYQSATQQSLQNYQQRQAANVSPELASQQTAESPDAAEEIVGVSRPLWVGDRLILARRVLVNGETRVQGCLLDWPALKKRLLDEAVGLLPGANLMRADGDAADDPSRMLAGLPVRLVVNEQVAVGAVSPTLGWALWMGWGAVALAVLAAAALLHGVMTLSERRAAFVSSVTHELRTPLTTFRMYAEMLARGMVPEASRRQEYFDTLQREAERLTLLVENVLAYARLERGRKPQRQDRVTLKSLLERVGPRLANRAAQADMKCVIEINEEASKAPSPCPLPEGEGLSKEFTTDQTVVEQILFNLVDNAAKYARDAEDRQIHVEGSRNGEWVKLVVRDHGPGIEQRPWGRKPRAFGKSAQQSAETAPGVGLGLALCRRLARQLGGRLEICGANGGGAEVSLILPAT
jgi:signal transduction histidine kinase